MLRHLIMTAALAAASLPSPLDAAGFLDEYMPIVGNWHDDRDGGASVFAVDGRKWGNALSTGAADRAKMLYGERYAEFLDNVEAYKHFPLAIVRGYENPPDTFTVTLAFKGVTGKVDQAAGIAVGIKPDGDYLVVRANCLEHNLVLFVCEKGKRKSVQWIRNVRTPNGVWHELEVRVEGSRIIGYLNDVKYVDHVWREPVRACALS